MAARRDPTPSSARQEGLGRGDQEGLSQARAPVPPDRNPDDAKAEDAQGGQRGARPALGPESGRRSMRRGRFGGRGPTVHRRRLRRRHQRHPLQPIRRRRRGRRGPARARAQRPSGGATSRPRSRSTSTRRFHGAQVPLRSPSPSRCTTFSAPRPPGHESERLPTLRRSRHRVPGPGHRLDLPALLALRRQRHRDRVAVPDLQGHRRDPRRQAPARDIPPACTTAAGSASPAGRGRAAQRSARRSLRDHARLPVTGLHPEGPALEVEVPLTIVEALRGPRSGADVTGRKTLRSPRGTSTGPSRAARRGPRSRTGRGNGDIHYRFVIELSRTS